MTIVYAIAVLGVLAIVFGLILAVAAKVFEVEVDPRLPEIQACLAGANCGGCGYPGCGGCAEAILAGKAPVTACAPAGAEGAAKIAAIMGMEAPSGDKMVAHVLCNGGCNAKDNFEYRGVKDCLDVCEAMKTGEVAGCFIEMNACHGGCVNGPSTATSVSSFKVKLDLEAMLPKEPADLSLMHEAARQVEIHRTFVDRSQKERIPTEEEIREILKKTGKMTPEQELNCGACGYPTCREKAIAVFQKKAEVDMCIPYLHDRAQSLSHLVMDTSPNLIMIIDDDMRIQECSVAAEMYFGVKPEAIKGKPLEDFINAEDVREVFRTHTSVHSRKVIYPDRNLVTLQNIAYIDDGNFVIATIIDVTREEKQAKQEYAKKKATIDLAQNVIYKQMMVAQNIAGLLGETTAETKTTLMKLCSLIDDESESEVR